MPSPLASLIEVRPADEKDGVTTLELFFDLVYVFAFTQVSALIAHGPLPESLLDGFIVFALLWWTWCSYAWLANGARANAGIVRLAVLLVTPVMFIASLSIPEAFHDRPGGLNGAAVLVVCYALARLIHIGAYLVVAGENAALRRQVWLSLLTSAGPAVALLALGVALGPEWQRPLWLVAVLYDLAVIFLTSRGGGGWVLTSAGHFAERHGLVVILALGESIVAIAVGAAAEPISMPLIVVAVLAVATTVGLWLHYFQGAAQYMGHALKAATGSARAHLARDLDTYLHLPIVGGIIVAAFGIEQAVAHIPDKYIGSAGAWALAGGISATLLALTAAQRRVGAPWPWWQLGAVAGVLAAAPVLGGVPSAPALAVVAGILLVTAVGHAWSAGDHSRAGLDEEAQSTT